MIQVKAGRRSQLHSRSKPHGGRNRPLRPGPGNVMDRLRIASFNLDNLDDRPDAEPPLTERIAVLRPLLCRLAADILCLQEVNAQQVGPHRPRRFAALQRLLETTPYADYSRCHTTIPSGETPADRHNLVLLSRFPLETWRQIRNELVRPLLYRPSTGFAAADEPMALSWDRPILYAAVILPGGGRLHLLNLHLKAPVAVPIPGQKLSADHWKSVGGWAEGFLLASVKRAAQALEARLLIERLFDAEPRTLVLACGDFNADEREVPLRIVLGDEAEGIDDDACARILVALERSVPAAHRHSVVHAGHRALFDHLIASRTLAAWPHRVEIHNDQLRDDMAGGSRTAPTAGSSHAPILVEFELPPLDSVGSSAVARGGA